MLGYWKKPEATPKRSSRRLASAPATWAASTPTAFLWITGRKKELIVTASGKNIAPVYLERLLAEDPLILQALIVGDRRNYLAALIVPNVDVLAGELKARGVLIASVTKRLLHPKVLALYRERIDARLAGVSRSEQIGSFRLVDRSFSIEHDELTPTLKLRRSVIQEHFAREIEAMYRDEGPRAPIMECGPA